MAETDELLRKAVNAKDDSFTKSNSETPNKEKQAQNSANFELIAVSNFEKKAETTASTQSKQAPIFPQAAPLQMPL